MSLIALERSFVNSSNQPKVCIVTDAGKNIGFGHVQRCLAISEAFSKLGINPRIILDGDKNCESIFHADGIKLQSWHSEHNELYEYLKKFNIIIVDSLQIDKNFCQNISNLTNMPVFIDDFIRMDHRQGIIIDWTILAEDKFYTKKYPGVKYLLGSRYAALRRGFWETPAISVKRHIENFLVTFGGSDVANLTPVVLSLLNEKYPDITVRVIIGPGFSGRNIEKVKNLKKKNNILLFNPKPPEIVEAMLASDIAISAGGQTIYELVCLRIPTIGIMVVNNQLDDLNGWSETGYLEFVGNHKDKDIFERIKKSISALSPYTERQARVAIAAKYIDGNGAIRLVTKLLELYENSI